MRLLNFLEKVSAPLALIVTTIFSYLSWTEARHATALQKSFFAAQNGPRIAVSDAYFGVIDETNDKVLVLVIKNIGGSEARALCISTKIAGSERLLFNSCSQAEIASTLRKDDEEEYVIQLSGENLKQLGFQPIEILLDPTKRCEDSTQDTIVVVNFRYQDATEQQLDGINRFGLCGSSARQTSAR